MSDTLRQSKTPDLVDYMIRRLPGLKAEERIKLITRFDKADDFSLLSKRDLEEITGRALPEAFPEMADIRSLADREAAAAVKFGLRAVSWRDEAYPPLLREIYEPPVLLFYRGALPDPEKPLAAVVGTRKPTRSAAARAFSLGRDLGKAGIPVVSGLALGIDAMAHRGNIEGRAPTIAVLGSSPEMVYPPSNRDLARRIIETGGALLSEYPPGTPPYRSNFPARNRIISGLARGVVIVEAPEKSGALITARFAVEQNRDLWIDEYGAASPKGAGCARLAGEGAKLISSAEDILLEWNLSGPTGPEKKQDNSRRGGAGLASSLAEYLDIKL